MSKMIFCVVILLLGFVCGQRAGVRRECNPIDELPCNNGNCIHKMQWCDASVDCLDGSDEMYCNGDVQHRHSIEVRASETDFNSSLFDMNTTMHSDDVTKHALAKAAEYLLKQKNADYGWGAFTPRAVVALSLAGRVYPIAEKEKQLLRKQLDVQLLLDLMQSKAEMSLSSLALYVNALYATCQDPRHFHGIDLVARLRSETDAALKSNSSIPLAFLTLCVADQINSSDGRVLSKMYHSKEFDRTGSRALIVMALICFARKTQPSLADRYINDFYSRDIGFEKADVYTQALFMQASIAVGYPTDTEELSSRQFPDGSFGDMLATYYAVPVLMNSSLLNLKCNSSSSEGISLRNHMVNGNEENSVDYSLWISSGKDVNSHSMTVTFDGERSFFDVMLMAAVRDPLYRFLYDDASNGKVIYSLADFPNDAESGKSWMLYRGSVGSVVVNSVQNLILETRGVDRIFPENKSHFVFWFRRHQI